ncbi:MAG: IclR family transcriptional regulator [Pseudomonadota bacterium]
MSNDSLPREKRSGTIQSVSIAARFLRVLSNAEEPLQLRELARLADTGSSTAHRYLQSLIKEGLASQDSETGRYDLGPTSLSVGIAALQRIEPVEIAARHMKQLSARHTLSAGVAVWTERGPTLVRWYRSAYFAIGSIGLGDILPLDNTATGLLFQAFFPESKISPIRELHARHFDGVPPTADILEQIRSTRFAEMSGHLSPGVTGQAVPVFDAQCELVCVMTTVANLGAIQDFEDRVALFNAAKLVARETGAAAAFDSTEREDQ